ncbi:Branched-chain amino acid transport system / permease component [Acididesulfobacillus acetoxydans]|uniref:ABC transporter permease n=1 Tax=Acididesulfobacillus acetoxydans TaxID=1561005 RepID=A0A8S0Y1C4_9FIRM|nr:branched-chain amino acid ABC transporter permease [Acididesulfobacillus acetoxydans]CAA7599405.1 Branched-chain amino acid transport system / permease component [Acididesulfobacillus acetoxydans]CEJ06789.1 ABC transporter permease [Acididesulfobacillus acetoxydans]
MARFLRKPDSSEVRLPGAEDAGDYKEGPARTESPARTEPPAGTAAPHGRAKVPGLGRPGREVLLWVSGLPVLVVLILAVLPLLTSSYALFNLMDQILILGVFAMSYDILLGYTGIVSFGHVLFFGTGAYTVAIILKHTGPGLGFLLLAVFGTVLISLVISLVIGYLSLRVKDVYYAMITLAFAELFAIIAEKWRGATNGADGFSFRIPHFLEDPILFYYFILVFAVLTVILVRRFIHSPTGRVLLSIRENEKRAEFLGYNVIRFKLISTLVAGVVAGLAGIAWALQQAFVSTGVMATDKTIDALLITTIGGSGTLYGAFIGSGLTNFASDRLSSLAEHYPLLQRWHLIFGLLYILIVLFFPGGILGFFRGKRAGKGARGYRTGLQKGQR